MADPVLELNVRKSFSLPTFVLGKSNAFYSTCKCKSGRQIRNHYHVQNFKILIWRPASRSLSNDPRNKKGSCLRFSHKILMMMMMMTICRVQIHIHPETACSLGFISDQMHKDFGLQAETFTDCNSNMTWPNDKYAYHSYHILSNLEI